MSSLVGPANRLRIGLALLSACLPGCLSGASFTTARSVGKGQIEHGPSLEITLPQRGPGADIVNPGALPAYSVHYGVHDRVELSGKLSPFSAQLGAKFVLLDTEQVALAVLPRYTTGGVYPGATPHMLHAPLLLTLQPHRRVQITQRAGLAGVFGEANPSGWLGGTVYHVEGLHAECGLTTHVGLSERVALVFDAGALLPFGARAEIIPSFGLGVRIGPPPARRAPIAAR